MRALRLPTAAIAFVLAVSGCGVANTDADELGDILDRTRLVPARFVYEEQADGRAVRVTGAIEDSLRFDGEVSISGERVASLVVHDDALAARVHGPLGSDAIRPLGEVPDGVAQLNAGSWVLDPHGAPARDPSADDEALGSNPLFDAVRTLDYARRAMRVAGGVTRYNPESIDYRAHEDPFPPPDKRLDEVRYDLRPASLPSAAQVAATNEVPGAPAFRRLSVYVRNGIAVRVEEAIDVEPELDELEKIYEVEFPADRDPREIAVVAVDTLNVLRVGKGDEPIRPRRMSLVLEAVGEDVQVALPDGHALDPNLGSLEVSLSVLGPSDANGTTPGTLTPGRPAEVRRATHDTLTLDFSFPEPDVESPVTPVGLGTVALWLLLPPTLLGAGLAGWLLRRPRGAAASPSQRFAPSGGARRSRSKLSSTQ